MPPGAPAIGAAARDLVGGYPRRQVFKVDIDGRRRLDSFSRSLGRFTTAIESDTSGERGDDTGQKTEQINEHCPSSDYAELRDMLDSRRVYVYSDFLRDRMPMIGR